MIRTGIERFKGEAGLFPSGDADLEYSNWLQSFQGEQGMRQLLVAASLVAASMTTAHAEDLKGTVATVDAKNNRLTVQIDGKPKTFDVLKDATIVEQGEGSKKKAAPITPITNGLAGVKPGSSIELRTEDQDGKTVVSSVKVSSTPAAAANTQAKPKPAVKPVKNPNKVPGVRKKSLRKKLATNGRKKPKAMRKLSALR